MHTLNQARQDGVTSFGQSSLDKQLDREDEFHLLRPYLYAVGRLLQ